MTFPKEVEGLLPALAVTPVAALITDSNGAILWINETFAHLTGHVAGDVVGRNFAALHPSFYTALQHLKSAESWQADGPLRRPDGRLLTVGAAISGIRNASGTVTHYLCLFTDRQSYYSKALMSMAEGVMFEGPGGLLHVANDSLQQMLGLTVEQISRRAPLDPGWQTIREDGSPFPSSEYPARITLETGRPISDVMLGVRKPDGSLTWLTVNSRPVPSQDGSGPSVVTTFRDSTEQKRVHDALVKSEQEWSKAFLASPMASVITTATSGERFILNVNPAFEALIGCKREQLLGRTSRDFNLWVDTDHHDRIIALLKAEGRLHAVEVSFRNWTTGLIRKVLISMETMEMGGRSIFLSSVVDITDRLRAESHYRLLFNSVSDAVFVFRMEAGGTSGTFIDVNDKACQMLGYARDELLAMHASAIGLPESPHNIGLSGTAYETALLARDGGRIPVELNAQPLELDGAAFVICTVRDLSKRREAERRYQTIFNGAIEGIFRSSLEGRPIEVNPAMARIFGYESPQDYIAAVAESESTLGLNSEQKAYFLAALRVEGSLQRSDVEIRRKDGTSSWISFNCRTVKGPDGQPLCYEGSLTDISERKRAEHEKASLEERLRQSQKLEGIGRLAGGVAHEFNNLLTVINGYAGFLLDKLKTDDPLRTYADTIKTSGSRAASLTRALLAFSRKQTIRPRQMDLNADIRAFARVLEPFIGENISLSTQLDDTLNPVTADPDQFHQVMMNLVLNARDAMRDGGELRISTNNVELGNQIAAVAPDLIPGSYAQITVSDTGHGMDEDVRRHIFEPFFTTKEVGEGSGLGLSTVYGIVRQSGGWTEVESQPGIGTTFRVYLPTTAALRTLEPSPVTRSPGGAETILIIEDQKGVRNYTRVALEDIGYRVLEAADGQEAIAVAERFPGPIHLVLTDIVLPGINGLNVSAQLTAMRPDLKVIYMSGYPGAVIGEKGGMAEGITFLPKPYGPDELADKVREVLGK